MAMNSGDLANSIIDAMEIEHNATNTDDVVSATIVQIPKEDGTLESTVEFERGTLPFDREAVAPLARAIARAVVQHITARADVDDNDVGAGGTWRIS